MRPYEVHTKDARRVVVLFSPDEISEVDQLGVKMGFRSRAEAIRHLIREGHASVEKTKGAEEAATSPRHVTSNP